MIYYFRTLCYRDDYGPTVGAIWYGADSNCWDIRYDTEDDRLEASDYQINDYAL